MSTRQKIKKHVFQDETGKYVVGQPPNMLIYIMFVGFAGQLVTSGTINTFFDLLFFGAAFAWSYLEIRFGGSNFRKIMGIIVLTTIFVSRLT